jgi:cytidyltransferase-like protein
MTETNNFSQPRIGLVTGVFDLLHQGHVQLLTAALNDSDNLYLGLESDSRVMAEKGEQRPLRSQDLRQVRLSSLLEKLLQQRQHRSRNWRALWQIEVLPENFGDKQVRLAWLQARRINTLFVTEKDKHLGDKKRMLLEISGNITTVPVVNDQLGRPLAMSKILQGKQSPDYLVFTEDELLVARR